MFEHVTDHGARALALLPDQFQKDGIRALLSSWTPEFQEIEDALWALFEATIDTSTGARLDQYAVLLGEPRQTLTDAALRKVLRARILANRSQGRDADLRAVLLVFAVTFTVQDYEPASVLVTLGDFPGAGLPQRIASLVRRAVGGGVGVQTISPAVAGNPFILASQSEDVEVAPGFGLSDAGQTQGGALCGVMV